MADKRFWSGAIIVVTVVVAGAGSLPALLLRPAAPEAAPVIAIAPPKAPEPVAPRPAEPVVQRAAEPVSVPPEPVRLATPVSTPAAASPGAVEPAPAVSQPVQVAAPPEPPPQAQPVAFPPVQPVGIATRSAPEAAAPPAPTQTRPASATIEPEKAARPSRVAAQGDRKRKRSVRPAAYPIREFLAWRR